MLTCPSFDRERIKSLCRSIRAPCSMTCCSAIRTVRSAAWRAVSIRVSLSCADSLEGSRARQSGQDWLRGRRALTPKEDPPHLHDRTLKADETNQRRSKTGDVGRYAARGMPVSNVDEYRANAAGCRRMADGTKNAREKHMWRDMSEP